MPKKGVGFRVPYTAWDTTVTPPVRKDELANLHTATVSKDGGGFNAITPGAPTKITGGNFYVDLSDTEANADIVEVQVTSSSGAVIAPAIFYMRVNTEKDVYDHVTTRADTLDSSVSGIQSDVDTIDTVVDGIAAAAFNPATQRVDIGKVVGGTVTSIDDFKDNIAGLATSASVSLLQSAVGRLERVLGLIYTFTGPKKLLDDFSAVWASSDAVNLTPSSDGDTMSVLVTIDGAQGDYLEKTYGDGEELDLSSYKSLLLRMRSGGAGTFLALQLQNKGGSWASLPIVVADTLLNDPVMYELSLSTIPVRTQIVGIRLAITGTGIDVSELLGEQLYRDQSPVVSSITLQFESLEAQKADDRSSVARELITASDLFKADVTGLASLVAVSEATSKVQDVVGMLLPVYEAVSGRYLLDTCSDGWVSSDSTNLSVSYGAETWAFGGKRMSVLLSSIYGALDQYIAKELPSVVDLSGCNYVYVTLKAQGTGSWLQFELSEDGIIWDGAIVVIPDGSQNQVITLPVALSGITRDSIQHIRFKIISPDLDISEIVGEQLARTYGIDSAVIEIDRIEAYRNFGGQAGSDWV